MKKYYKVTVTQWNNEKFDNPLTLSESNIIMQLIRAHKSVNVELAECTPEYYKLTFGK